MSSNKQTARLLRSCTAISLICAGSAGHAGGLTLLKDLTGKVTKTTSKVTGTVTSTVAKTVTPTVPTVVKVVPLAAKPVDLLTRTANPLVVTVSSAPGSVTSTADAAVSVVANGAGSGLPLLLPNNVFVNPQAAPIEPKWGKIRSFWGKIRSFEGEEVTPFWGKIRSFWGNAGPFEGDTAAFWGNLQTYNDGGDPNAVTPEWGKIRSFWDELGTSWGDMRPAWHASDYQTVAGQLRGVVDRSATFWGDAVEARTGKDFYAGFANGLLGRYGIDLNDPSSLARLDANQREHFFLEWYDGLMQYSGADNPDYWMRQVDWSPRITQTLGEGKDSVIGLLDFTVTGAEAGNITHYDGVSTFANGHGAAVASLMVSAHDGRGVMGIAPMASVVAYNPFDASETAGWSDIKDGIRSLGTHGASIINMSLGVPGWTLHPDWNAVFNDPGVALSTASSVFVIAAGNDGISQTQNISWSNTANFIVVGSVDPARAISDFSNRPGTACLLTDGRCRAGSELMNRFIVAPGEMILVSDGHGGVTRYSGTSFAAPLVSGTVALIHDRWPWLSKYPKETVDIILKTATDLGAPGVDPVYGVGQLNVTGALSPIDYNKLTWYQMDDQGRAKPMSSAMVRTSGNLDKWEAAGMYFYAFETIGGSYRDFAIPLSSKLVDSKALSAGMSKEQFQAYLYNQVIDWIKKSSSFTDSPSLNYTAVSAAVGNPDGLKVTMSLAPRTLKAVGFRQGQSPYQTSLRVADRDGRFAFKVGEGDGAIELGNSLGFGRASDYDPSRGGANPLLGMASGGSYGQLSYNLNAKLSISAGATRQNTRYDPRDVLASQWMVDSALDGYRTSANTVSVSYRPRPELELTGSYTRLHERDAILGIQALSPELLGGGAATDGMTLGATYAISPTFQVAASATLGRTSSTSANALITTGAGGFKSTAYQIALSKQQLFGRHDALRLTLAQPLHVENGSVDVTSLQVIDRETGELGLVTERFVLPGKKRPLVGEFQYAAPLLEGQADLTLFGKMQLAGDPATDSSAAVMTGARFTLRY